MKVAVFGLGYVGSVTAACLAKSGHQVFGVDVDEAKLGLIAAGRSPVVEPGLSELVSETVGAGRLRPTPTPSEALAGADVSVICVGTPTTYQAGTNLSYVFRVVENLAAVLPTVDEPPSGVHTVVVRSTVPPGTVERVDELLKLSMAGTGRQTAVAMCPEFLREGSAIADFYSPPFTVIGAADPAAAGAVERLLSFLDGPVEVVDLRTAEALKYACNAFHAAKVSFTNELGRLLRVLGVDSRRVMSLFCQDRQLNISPSYLRPGFAFGGSCLPKDLRSLLHLGRMEGLDLPLLSGVIASNSLSISSLVERVVSSEGRTVAMLGLSFKAASDDLRESPYVEVAETLLGKGYQLRIYDPIINPAALIGANREYVESKLPHLRRILSESATDALEGADVAVVSSAASEVVEALLSRRPARILDLDGRLPPLVEALPGYEGALW
jgi:GDP-mannose 6-dehydrogenase